MTLVRKRVQDAAVGVAVADTADALGTFLQPGCVAAIWRRHMPRDVGTWLDGQPPKSLPRGRINVHPDAVEDAVRAMCAGSGLPDGPERDWLVADASALAAAFSQLLSPRFLRLRLDVVNTDACRRFHIDAVTARLVCTYRGTGTQYGVSTDGNDPARVFTVPTGAPILLRGTLWPTQPPSGLLHRSPPIEGTGETRLVLVLDPLDEDQDAA
ncbi:MAG: DUF1826 domain-containing protein [Pseudomonadota bacterium]